MNIAMPKINQAKSFIPVVLSGGAGSRLWPQSRRLNPKQFLKLDDGTSFIQRAFNTGTFVHPATEIMTVAGRDLYFRIRDEYFEINNGLHESYILEPFGRNTAGAIAAAALLIEKKYGKQAIMLVLASDHIIQNQKEFQSCVEKAMLLATQGQLVTFGILPERPDTGYGYIEREGQEKVKRFVEKPNLEKAQEYLAQGNFYWNSGMFCFQAGTILDEMRLHCPEIIKQIESCLSLSKTKESINGSKKQTEVTETITDLDSQSFSQVQSVSIDYAVMEKSSRVCVVPSNIGWSDVGSWSAFSQALGGEDQHGNLINGPAEYELVDTKNCMIHGTVTKRVVGTVGVENLIIVDTPDALLVASKESEQKIKEIYESLKRKNHPAHEVHQTASRPWGTYTVLEEASGHKVKRIDVKPGGRLSLQSHKHRHEHWVVITGTATITNGDKVLTLTANQSTFIPAHAKHRLENLTNKMVSLIEVQYGDYLGEDDIQRFSDIYQR